MPRQKVTPFLWFDNQAEEAAQFYVSLFKDSKINRVVPGPGGAAMVVEFQLAGVAYVALNGGPHYQLTEAFSLSVDCESQAEVDELWEKLSEGGSQNRCGWLKDRYGLSWQIVPSLLPKLMSDSDPAKAGRVMQAMMQMTKIDMAALQRAYDGQ